MHYKNGREAKLGDAVVKRNPDGSLVIGTVVALSPGAASCNIGVATYYQQDTIPNMCIYTINPGSVLAVDADGKAHVFHASTNTCQNASDYLHVDDALKAFEKLEAQLP